jgi:acyl-CoA thioester hydrolase
MNQKTTVEKIRVRYGETDMMGHAYYANYLFWFEQARGAWCRERGFTYLSLEERGIKLPVVEANLRYKGEAKYDDLLEVHITLTEVRRSSMRFDYEIRNQSTGLVCTTGHTVHAVVDPEIKTTRLPQDMRELLGRDPADFDTVP